MRRYMFLAAAVLLVACGTTADPEPKAVEVPDLLGETLTETREWALDEGVTIDDESWLTAESKSMDPGDVKVIGTCPVAGDMLEPGQTLEIAAAPQQLVPQKRVDLTREDPDMFIPCS